jgi:hypothetical protein
VLYSGGLYVDFRSPDETFVVFAGRVFRYRRGDDRRRAEAVYSATTAERSRLGLVLRSHDYRRKLLVFTTASVARPALNGGRSIR